MASGFNMIFFIVCCNILLAWGDQDRQNRFNHSKISDYEYQYVKKLKLWIF